MIEVKRSAISEIASSHVIGSNSPAPFGPLRRSGVVSRDGSAAYSSHGLTFVHS
jgi:hypothetical protein